MWNIDHLQIMFPSVCRGVHLQRMVLCQSRSWRKSMERHVFHWDRICSGLDIIGPCNMYIYLETRLASKFWCWSSETVFYLNAAGISGMRRSLGNRHHFRFWCWNAPFLPIIAPLLPVIAPFLPVQNFHCAVFVELHCVFYIAPFLLTCACFFLQFGNAPKILGTWVSRYIYVS